MNTFTKKYLPYLFPIGLGLELLVLLLSYLETGDYWHLFFRATARLSGRVYLLYFAHFLVYATLNPSAEKGSEPLKTKFILARNFAIMHIIHWFLLVTAIKMNGFELPLARLVPGIIAYSMVVLMPFVLNGNLFKTIKLSLAQNVYVYYVWLLFFLTYLARLSGNSPTATGTMPVYIALMIVTISLLVWRILYLANQSKKV